MAARQKIWVIGGVCALIAALLFALVPPIAQDPAYHHFSDPRVWLGVPNFGDVVSNTPFGVVGLWGLWNLWAVELVGLQGRRAEATRLPLTVFFLGVMLIAPGSAFYHWSPDNATLFWDRLPMTAGFMGLTAAVFAERIDARVGVRYALPVLIAVGLASVVYWRITETAGAGDLRAYVLVQFLPMVAIPLMVGLFPKNAVIGWRVVGVVFVFYGLAKAAEHFDHQVLEQLGGVVSGHTLKHLLAAGGPLAVGMNLRR